jgi:DNA-binding Xre family transcriptional regulator
MIKPNIKQIAEKNGVTTAYQLQKLLGIQPSLAAKWYRNDLKMIGFDSLNTLCKAFNCLPSDLIIYTPDTANDTKLSNVTLSNSLPSNTILSNAASDNKKSLPSVVKKKAKIEKVANLPELSNGDKWLKTAEIAERLGIKAHSTVRDFYNKQGLVHTRVGMVSYVKESDLNAFLANRKTRGQV